MSIGHAEHTGPPVRYPLHLERKRKAKSESSNVDEGFAFCFKLPKDLVLRAVAIVDGVPELRFGESSNANRMRWLQFYALAWRTPDQSFTTFRFRAYTRSLVGSTSTIHRRGCGERGWENFSPKQTGK